MGIKKSMTDVYLVLVRNGKREIEEIPEEYRSVISDLLKENAYETHI